jgi:hypothetical protein
MVIKTFDKRIVTMSSISLEYEHLVRTVLLRCWFPSKSLDGIAETKKSKQKQLFYSDFKPLTIKCHSRCHKIRIGHTA